MLNEWRGLDPNSANQRWSRWTIRIQRRPGQPTTDAIRDNARRFFRALFRTTVGAVKVTKTDLWIHVFCDVEGVDVHDSGLRAQAFRQIEHDFVRRKFGPLVKLDLGASLLAGSSDDGKPAAQLIVLPTIRDARLL